MKIVLNCAFLGNYGLFFARNLFILARSFNQIHPSGRHAFFKNRVPDCGSCTQSEKLDE